MPIYLPPLSRRTFLARSLSATVGAFLAPELFAASRKTDPDTIALVSDIHIAADARKMARNINMTDHFIAVRKEILNWRNRPNTVLINGDLAFNSGETTD